MATAVADQDTSNGTVPAPAPRLELIPLEHLVESPLNTRKHFDAGKLEELKTSIEKAGILTPLLVRPVESRDQRRIVYEIAAGHRRFRAAQLAGVAAAPCVVREMDDATFLEILTIENLQREDVHPLEEAEGYRNLLTLDGYDIKKIASRVGKSESYVYDRMKLLQLTAPAKKLFFANRFTHAHATLLARLSKDDQARCLSLENPNSYGSAVAGGMWQHEGPAHPPLGLEDPTGIVEDKDDPTSRLKPVSVRELQAWIDDHVRFTGPDASTPHLFADTAVNLDAAKAEKQKVIEISRDHMLKEDAKHPDGKRTYCVTSWKRADGQPEEETDGTKEPSTTCDHSVLGIVVAGRGRGESFQVCIDKKRCTTHWAEAIKERNRREREKAKEASGEGKTKAAPKEESWERDQRLRKAKAERYGQRWEKGSEAVLAAIAQKVAKMPIDSTGAAAKWLWEMIQEGHYGLDDHAKTATKLGIRRGATATDFMRHVIMCDLVYTADPDGYRDNEKELQDALDELKLKVNVTQLLDAANPKPKAETPAKAPSNNAAKKGGKRAAGKALKLGGS